MRCRNSLARELSIWKPVHPAHPSIHAESVYFCVRARAPSPTLSPTDPVPRGLLTLSGIKAHVYVQAI